MSLLESHKAERRARILDAARDLIARHGYDGLTMRELAKASRVSVPTIYNLIGGKTDIVAAEMEVTAQSFGDALRVAAGKRLVDRTLAIYVGGARELFATPGYYRELFRMFFTNPQIGCVTEQRYIALMSANLAAARADGELSDWVDPAAVARQLFSLYSYQMLGWSIGNLTDEQFEAWSVHGMCLILLGLAHGDAARRLRELAQQLEPKMTWQSAPRAREGTHDE
jgi:AcrR family transcriptional regulator